MLPKVIIHNSISLDGSLTNFEPNMELHYQIAGNYKPQVNLIGSNTVKVGLTLFEQKVPTEEAKDFEKPARDKSLPYWAIIDTKGTLKGVLHAARRFEYCRDVAVMVSEETPKEYLDYLKERKYDHFVVGKSHADLKKTLEVLAAKYKAKTILTDTGKVLGNLLLDQSLASEISLLIHPIIVGANAYHMFSNIIKTPKLKLIKEEKLNKGYVWLAYKVIKDKNSAV